MNPWFEDYVKTSSKDEQHDDVNVLLHSHISCRLNACTIFKSNFVTTNPKKPRNDEWTISTERGEETFNCLAERPEFTQLCGMKWSWRSRGYDCGWL